MTTANASNSMKDAVAQGAKSLLSLHKMEIQFGILRCPSHW